MARHANFSAVASFRGDEINRRLAAAVANLGPFFFPLPQKIEVGGDSVALGGFVSVAAPVLEFHSNPQDRIRAHFSFLSTFTGDVGGSWELLAILGRKSEKWRVRLDVTVDLNIQLGPQNGQIVLSVDFSTVTFQPLAVTFLAGPVPPPEVIAALQSQDLADLATNLVRRFGIMQLAQLMPANLEHTQPASFKEAKFSVFNWFTIVLTVNRTELKVFEDAVTIAVDFAGITHGDRNQLVDLTRTHGGGVIYVNTPVYDDRYPNGVANTRPDAIGYSTDTNYAFTFNLEVLSSAVQNQVSPSVAGTPITDKAVLDRIRFSYATFDPDKDIAGPYLRKDDALCFRLKVTAYGVQADVVIFVQPYWDGGHWYIRVGRIDVDLPWWAELGIGIAKGLLLIGGIIVAVPASLLNPDGLLLAWRDWIDGFERDLNQADQSNIENEAKSQIQSGIGSTKLPDARYISISPVGVTMALDGGGTLPERRIAGGSLDFGFGNGTQAHGTPSSEQMEGAEISPTGSWSVYDRRPIQTAVKLIPTWEKLNRSNLLAEWEIRRKDTNAVVVTGVKQYNAPAGNGVDIPHNSKELYLVSEFVIRCKLTMMLGSQAGEIWSGQTTIKIDDDLNRSLPFVEWGPAPIFFKNPGTDNEIWKRISRSRIHRTAVALRCKYLRLAARVRVEENSLHFPPRLLSPPFRYRDTLPFDWANLSDHRKEICEYCFFGGPTKKDLYPREDSFDPNDLKPFEVVNHHLFG